MSKYTTPSRAAALATATELTIHPRRAKTYQKIQTPATAVTRPGTLAPAGASIPSTITWTTRPSKCATLHRFHELADRSSDCYTHFTEGQVTRMRSQWYAYRAPYQTNQTFASNQTLA